MQNIQDCLTIIIVVLFNLATAMIALDLSITLVTTEGKHYCKFT